MTYRSGSRLLATAVTGVLLAIPHANAATARTPSISGNGWIALGVIGFFVVTIYMLIRGALFVDRRDLGYGRRRTDDGWFGIFPHNPGDDEDSPDYHHHHPGGGDGGEGGDGGHH